MIVIKIESQRPYTYVRKMTIYYNLKIKAFVEIDQNNQNNDLSNGWK